MSSLSKSSDFEGDKDLLDELVDESLDKLGLYNISTVPSVSSLSSKATIECSYGDGGTVGHLASFLSANERISRADSFLGFVGRGGSDVVEVRGYDVSNGELAEHLTNNYFTFSNGLWECQKSSRAMPACILEPMKVRIITKPEVGQYVPLQCLQKVIWSKIYHHGSNTFKFIGEPADSESIMDFVSSSPWFPGMKWISGDYSAATDNLNAYVSQLVARKIFGNYYLSHPELYERIIKSLFGCEIDYTMCKLPMGDPWAKVLYNQFGSAKEATNAWRKQFGLDTVIEQKKRTVDGKCSFIPAFVHMQFYFILVCTLYLPEPTSERR